jgi:hypothetical protein
MNVFQPSILLRRVLLANALGNGLLGAAAILFTQLLADLLGLSSTAVMAAGIYLVLYAGMTGWLASRETLTSLIIWALMGFNAVWAFESIVLLVFDFVSPNGLGTLVVCAEAWLALLFVELQHVGLCRSKPLRRGGPTGTVRQS